MSYGSFSPSALASIFAYQSAPQVLSYGFVWGDDGVDSQYRFDIYDISASPVGTNAIYVFARLEGSTYLALYIGRAEVLERRLSNHERRDEAIRQGARALLVHIPGSAPRVAYVEAERRLIRRYGPILNEQHNPLAGLFGG
jgi:predicted GIY-YIG superfamily endonuclease